MVRRHHWLNGHEFEQNPGDSEAKGCLACCSPWGSKESDMTEWLNNNIAYSSPSCLQTLHPWIQSSQNRHFGPSLVESMDAKPMNTKYANTEGQLYIYWKNLHLNWSTQFKPMLFKGQLYLSLCQYQCFDFSSFVVSFEIRKCETSNFVHYFQSYFGYSESRKILYKIKMILLLI